MERRVLINSKKVILCWKQRSAERRGLPSPLVSPEDRFSRVIRFERVVAGPKPLTLIDHVGVLIGGDLSGIPSITSRLRHGLRGAGDEDLESGLALAAALGIRGNQFPAQARLGDVEAQRILQVLATQVGDLNGRFHRSQAGEGEAE